MGLSVTQTVTRTLAASALLAFSFAHAADAAPDAEALYQTYCSQCHGINANGGGINASAMSVQPRDHTDKTEMSTRSDEELFKVIQQGGKSTNKSILMPAWGGNMTDAQIHAMVQHLRALCCEK